MTLVIDVQSLPPEFAARLDRSWTLCLCGAGPLSQCCASTKARPGARLSEWKQDNNESFEDYFHQKCVMYEGVLELPPWPGRTEAAMPFIAFLNEFDLKNGSRIEWFWHANSLVQRLRRSRGPGSARLLGQLESSTNLVLHLYARTERVLSTPTQKPEN